MIEKVLKRKLAFSQSVSLFYIYILEMICFFGLFVRLLFRIYYFINLGYFLPDIIRED